MGLELGSVPEWIEGLSGSGGLALSIYNTIQASRSERAAIWPTLVAELSAMSSAEIAASVEESPKLAELVYRAWEEAARTSDDEKFELLAKAAAAAVAGDDASPALATQLMATVISLEPVHVHLLIRVAAEREGKGPTSGERVSGSWPMDELRESWSGSNMIIEPLMARLREQALVRDTSSGTYDGLQGSETWSLSSYGQAFLRHLGIEATAATGPKAPRHEETDKGASAAEHDEPGHGILTAIADAEEEGADLDQAARAAASSLDERRYRMLVRRLNDAAMIDALIEENASGEIHLTHIRRITPPGLRAIGRSI